MEQLKHECGVAMIRLLKPLEYYEKKYGTWMYGLNKLYLLMEKQHNRGQEGAGLACVKLEANPGEEYMFREHGVMMGKIVFENEELRMKNEEFPSYSDINYVDQVSCKEIIHYFPSGTSSHSAANSSFFIPHSYY